MMGQLRRTRVVSDVVVDDGGQNPFLSQLSLMVHAGRCCC